MHTTLVFRRHTHLRRIYISCDNLLVSLALFIGPSSSAYTNPFTLKHTSPCDNLSSSQALLELYYFGNSIDRSTEKKRHVQHKAFHCYYLDVTRLSPAKRGARFLAEDVSWS